ncbi:MAG: hypothetical protein K5764_01825 [Prevotella sp.]|nr:hypothetical protein [Prevotella sp.]
MEIRYKKRGTILDIVIATVAAMLSIGTLVYGVYYFGLGNAFSRLGLVLDFFYIACVVMIWMYFFNVCINTKQFNYWCSLCIGVSVLLRDILFPTTLAYYPIQLSILTLSVLLLCMLTFFYARKDWKSYTKRDLWMICIVDTLIAVLYNIEIYLEPTNEYTDFFLVEIWTRPTITYGLVACFIIEGKEE